MKAIPVQVTFSDEEMRRAAGLHFDTQLKRGWLITRLVAAAAIIGGLFILRYEAWPVSALLMAIGILLYQFRRFFLKRCVTAGQKSPFHGEEQCWTLKQDHIQIQGPTQQAQLAYSSLSHMTDAKAGLLVYTGPGNFFWLPKTGFDSEESFQEARAHLLNLLD